MTELSSNKINKRIIFQRFGAKSRCVGEPGDRFIIQAEFLGADGTGHFFLFDQNHILVMFDRTVSHPVGSKVILVGRILEHWDVAGFHVTAVNQCKVKAPSQCVDDLMEPEIAVIPQFADAVFCPNWTFF